jgi:hypothetical protein
VRLVRVCVSALGCPERAERERDPHCSERADYEGKDFKEWLRGWVLGYVISTIFRCWAWWPEIGRAFSSLYIVLPSLPFGDGLCHWIDGWREGRIRKETATTEGARVRKETGRTCVGYQLVEPAGITPLLSR